MRGARRLRLAKTRKELICKRRWRAPARTECLTRDARPFRCEELAEEAPGNPPRVMRYRSFQGVEKQSSPSVRSRGRYRVGGLLDDLVVAGLIAVLSHP